MNAASIFTAVAGVGMICLSAGLALGIWWRRPRLPRARSIQLLREKSSDWTNQAYVDRFLAASAVLAVSGYISVDQHRAIAAQLRKDLQQS